MQCPKCDTLMSGPGCVCGYQSSSALSVGPAPGSVRRWKLCEWVYSGRTCQVPAGIMRSDGMRAEQFCAYHQHRQRLSLYGAFVSEQKAFLEWVEQFPPGVTYQPMPRIWDGDRDHLWLLITGSMSFEQYLSKVRERVS